VRHHSTEGLFALEKGSIQEYVMTWPEYKGRIDDGCEMDIGAGALI
jgi:hypothetical protein